jgi:predicted regulator of Ras-like GTPase activity (Roadblock/LC7/MglB family)
MASTSNSLASVMQLPGAIAAAVVDLESGMILAQAGTGLDLEVAAAGNTEVVRAKMRTMKALGLNTVIEDILITLGDQYHLIRPITAKGGAGLFIYAALDRSQANLALARRQVAEAEKKFTL